MSDGFWREYEEADGIEKALFAVAIALNGIAVQIKYLGNGDAATPMGAIEAFGKHMGVKLDYLAAVIGGEK